MSLVTHKYTPSEMSDRELEATFAAREHTIDYLLKALRDQTHSGTLSSFIVTGPRGSGKSTVIHMTVFRLKQDPKLTAAWIPVVFPEEQFNLASLRDLLAATLQQLAAQGHAIAQTWLQKVEAESNDEQSQQLAITGLREVTRQAGKRLILFVENLNLLLEESLNDQMKGTLRRLLMADPFMMLIGSAVRVFDSLKSYDQAFFNYFGQVPLDRLTTEQVFDLLTRRAKFDNNERFLREFPKQQPKVRAIVHLSGGNPRLTLMLYELLSQRQVTTIVQYLRRLVDELTPLLKDEMERLPPQQRKIIHALMEKGGTAQPTDLVGPTRLPLNAITTQLRRLKEAQVLEVLGGGKGKAANYTVPDKLFAIWYQMRYLSQNRRRIELFVEVLRIWFEEEERMQTLQSLTDVAQAGEPSALHETATTAEYFAASLKGTQREKLAVGLCIRHWVKADLHEAAQVYAEFFSADYGRVIPAEVEQHANLGDWLANQGDYSHAAQAMDEIISKRPKDPERLAWALYNRGVARGNTGDVQGAIADYTAVTEMRDAPKEQRANALINRGVSRGVLGNTQGAITDFTAVVEMEEAPKEQRGKALVNRGVGKGKLGDAQGAIADFTAALEMKGASQEQQGKALANRGVSKGKLGDIPGAVADLTAAIEIGDVPNDYRANALLNRGTGRGMLGDAQGAIADFTAALEMKGASQEQRARALIHRGVRRGKLGDTQGEIADYTAAAQMEDAPSEQRAQAFLSRGVTKGTLGDTQGEIADYTAIANMNDAPKDLRANALFNRAVRKRKLDDSHGAIADYTAMLEMEGVPKELHAKALFNRGMHRGALGDTRGEIADYTAVVDMEDVPKEERARALFNRAVSEGKLGDAQGEIADYTTLVGMQGGPKALRAKATFNRGATKRMLGNTEAALADFVTVIDLANTEDDLLSRAAQVAFELSWSSEHRTKTDDVLGRFTVALKSLPREKATEVALGFLNGLASPGWTDAWVHTYGILAKALQTEVKEALEFLEPVCAVLEGKDRSVLNSLPPEERDFAENVLKRFEPSPPGRT